MQNNKLYLYVAGSEGSISLYLMNLEKGKLFFQNKISTDAEPSFLTAGSDGKFLYACLRDDIVREVACYSIHKKNGSLTLINKVQAKGARPVHLSIDRTNKFIFQSNFNGGNFSVFPINPDGSICEAVQTIKIGEKAHQIRIDKNNKFVYIPHMESDFIAQYIFENGRLIPNSPDICNVKKGRGPRHIDFHPNGRWLYCVNELDNTVSAFNIKGDGALEEFQNLSSLPQDFNGRNKGADIHVLPSGKFVYSSNRGLESIAVYSIDQKSGRLKLLENISTFGIEPRNFTIDPSGNFLVAGNLSSDSIIVFKINNDTGMLEKAGDLYPHKMPICHVFV